MKLRASLRPFALLVALPLVGCRLLWEPDPPPLLRLRLVTWNIHHGEGLDGTVDLDHIAAELLAQRPDVVCLQEVDVGVARSQRLDIPQQLAMRLGMHAAFGKNIDYQGGDYGNAILSRWPIAWQHNLHYRMLREGEQRGLLLVGLDTGQGALNIGCTHLDYRPDDSERLDNVAEILTAVHSEQIAAIAGDFNDRPGSPVHKRLCSELRDAWGGLRDADPGFTYPADKPDRRIDWVMTWPRLLVATGGMVPQTRASDHRPVAIDLEVPPDREPPSR